jgi:hypothetical protein
VQKDEWRTVLIKLQLQENSLGNLEWMGELGACTFPNLKVLNLSGNNLTDIDALQFACPTLAHLCVSNNPLPCNLNALLPLKAVSHLMTLDASRTPLSAHKEYARCVLRNLKTVQVRVFPKEILYSEIKFCSISATV